MSVSVSTTNKPLNPRAQDLSPKGYNRAALYSGKALDFDGVNDSIAGEAPNLPSSDYTICAYFRIDYLSVGGMVTWGDFTTGERRSMLIWDGGHTGNFTLRSSTYGSNPEGSTYLETSKWYFGCVSVASSGEAKIYLNGQLDGSGTNTLNAYTNTDYLIGRTRGGEFFNGALANVRIFNQILTAAQVADLYLNPEKIVPDGVADSALKLWLPMMEGVGTTAYDGSPVGFTEDIVTGFTNGTTYPLDSFVSSGDDITTAIKTSGFGGCVSNGHYYTNGQKVKVKFTYQKNSGNDLRVLFSSLVTGAGTAKSDIQYVSASGEFEHTFTMTADGIAYLQLGTGNASDSIDAVITDVYVSPNVSANHGTINGATWVSGIGAPVAQTALVSWNKLYDFDGANDGAVSLTYVDTTGTKTYKVNFNSHDVTQADQQIFNFWNTSTLLGMGGTINFSGSNSGVLGIRGYGSGASFDDTSWSGLTNNTFYELEFTIDWDAESITSATLNGVASDGSVTARLSTVNNGLYLGYRVDTFYLNGVINYFEVVGEEKWTNASRFKSESGSYDMAIAGEQNPTTLFPQGLTSGRDITGVNAFESARNPYSLNLDGKSWAEVHDNASLDMTSAITLEAWVYWDGTATDDGIVGRWGSVSADQNYMLYAQTTNNARFYINNSFIAATISNGWNHFIGTYDKTTMKFYVNGSLKNSTANTADITTSDKPIEIGRYFHGATAGIRLYPNDIALPRIYNRALTATEVARNYNADKSKFGL